MITLGASGYFFWGGEGGGEEVSKKCEEEKKNSLWSSEPATSFAHDVWDEISHQTGFWGLHDVYFDSWWSGVLIRPNIGLNECLEYLLYAGNDLWLVA